MKFLAFADLHCHNYSQFSTILPDGTNSRLADCLDIFRQIREYGKEKGIKKVLFLGDLFNTRTKLAIDVYHKVFDELVEMKIEGFEVYLIVGNHDQFLKSGALHSMRPMSSVAEVIDGPAYIEELDTFAVPYIENLEARRRAILAAQDAGAGILAIHSSVDGAKVGPTDLVLEEGLKLSDFGGNKFRLVLLGHYHKSQKLAENIMYLGSPLQLNLGERNDGEKGFWIVDTEDYSMEMVATQYPKFIELENEWLPEEVKGNFVRLILGGSKEKDDLEVKKEIMENGARAVVIERQEVEEVQQRLDIKPGMSFSEMLEEFVDNFETKLEKKRLKKIGKAFLLEKGEKDASAN